MLGRKANYKMMLDMKVHNNSQVIVGDAAPNKGMHPTRDTLHIVNFKLVGGRVMQRVMPLSRTAQSVLR